MEATDTVGIWAKIYKMQLGSHGMGAACCHGHERHRPARCGTSSGKAAGMPIYKLLGGSLKGVPAYAGGVSLGYQPPAELIAELQPHLDAGYKALKLRVGDSPCERHRAHPRGAQAHRRGHRHAHRRQHRLQRGRRARRVMPAMEELNVLAGGALSRARLRSAMRMAATFSSTPLAAGENHYTRYEFNRVLEDGSISILQPDLSKTGGLTEALRIAHMGSMPTSWASIRTAR
jgi:D-galactarolactone cycloisomerase